MGMIRFIKLCWRDESFPKVSHDHAVTSTKTITPGGGEGALNQARRVGEMTREFSNRSSVQLLYKVIISRIDRGGMQLLERKWNRSELHQLKHRMQ